jgi:hypothetical protein
MNTAFFVVFGLFVLSMFGLAFMAVRWGIRRDRVARVEASEPHTEPGRGSSGNSGSSGSADR